MKATKQDYDYLIDQLSKPMEFYEPKEVFVNKIFANTSFSTAIIKSIWNRYQILDIDTVCKNTTGDWRKWIKIIIRRYESNKRNSL